MTFGWGSPVGAWMWEHPVALGFVPCPFGVARDAQDLLYLVHFLLPHFSGRAEGYILPSVLKYRRSFCVVGAAGLQVAM